MMPIARVVVAATVVAVALVGCAKESSDDAIRPRETTTTSFRPDRTTTTTTTTSDDALAMPDEPPDPAPPPADFPADGLEIVTLVEGTGPGAAAGDTLTVHYVGVLADGTVFDESWSGGEPFPVTLGEGQVIEGWDEGLVGAEVGERRRLVIGSDKGYGDRGEGPIPPGAPMVFEVDILAIDQQ